MIGTLGYPTAFELDATLRLAAAAGCGMLVGINRDMKGKPTGMRTLGLVGLGAALVALAGLQELDIRQNPDALSRVIQGVLQGVMTGVGFIGAGVILKLPQEERVRGLTTAASVWITAALGVACALASWWLMLAGVAMTLAVLTLPRRLARLFGVQFENDS